MKKFIPSTMRPDVTDHAVLRYLERVIGFDIEGARRDIANIVAPSMAIGASAFSMGGVTYKFDHERVVTVLPTEKPSQCSVTSALVHGEQPYKSAHNRREAHQIMRRRKK